MDVIKRYTSKFIPRLTENKDEVRPLLLIADGKEYDTIEFSSRKERRVLVNELNGKRLFFLAVWENGKVMLEAEDPEFYKYFEPLKPRDYVSVVPNKMV